MVELGRGLASGGTLPPTDTTVEESVFVVEKGRTLRAELELMGATGLPQEEERAPPVVQGESGTEKVEKKKRKRKKRKKKKKNKKKRKKKN